MQYQSVHLAIHLAISSLSFFILTNLDEIQRHLPWYSALIGGQYGTIAGAALAAGFVSATALLIQSSNRISRIIVEGLPISGLLRRALAGGDYIEGDWPLIVVYGANSPEPGKLLYIGFLSIGFRKDEYYVSGDDWTPDGVHAVCFESIRSSFHGDRHERRLQYFYRQGETWQDARMRGYTEIYFFPSSGLPELHAGQFRDAEHNDVRFYARRLSYRFGERRPKSSDEKKAAAKRVWEEFQPAIGAMINQPVSADWR